MASTNLILLRTLISSVFCCLLIPYPVLANQNGDYVISIYQSRMLQDKTSKVNRSEAVAHMNEHLLKYEKEAEKAAKQNSQMLVLPEYCLYADIKDFNRRSIENFLEPVPDPAVTFPWTPCDIENATDDMVIQKRLSCMAKKNKIYIVANTGDRQSCNRTVDYGCPYDNRFQFNTNVVYAPNGTLISRYRKKHLYFEPYFNEPRVAEHGVFETPFGRFASIVCFDIYYEDTFNELIQRQNVRNILFLNLWFSLPPLFLSVPFHSSAAWGANINLISANIIVDSPGKEISFTIGGSGFYSATSGYSYRQTPGLLTETMSNLKPGSLSNFNRVPKRKTPAPPTNQNVTIFSVGLMKVNSVRLVDQKGLISVCKGEFCCALDYEFASQPNASVEYMLGATNFADGSRQYDAQACSLCVKHSDKMCEGLPVNEDVQFARFKHLRLFANLFKTPFLYPQVTVINGSSYRVLQQKMYYDSGEMSLTDTAPLHSMSLLGRIYPPHVSGTSHPIISRALIIGLVVFLSLS